MLDICIRDYWLKLLSDIFKNLVGDWLIILWIEKSHLKLQEINTVVSPRHHTPKNG